MAKDSGALGHAVESTHVTAFRAVAAVALRPEKGWRGCGGSLPQGDGLPVCSSS